MRIPARSKLRPANLPRKMEESAEYRSFQSHYAGLFESISNPTTLAARLFSAGLLSRDTRKKIAGRGLTDSEKVSEILDAIETAIKLEPQNLQKFVVELEKDTSLRELCSKLRSTCGECVLVNSAVQCSNWCRSTLSSTCVVPITQLIKVCSAFKKTKTNDHIIW